MEVMKERREREQKTKSIQMERKGKERKGKRKVGDSGW